MTNAPVIKSFIDPNYLAQRIEQVYGIESVRVQLIKATMRDMYLVHCENKAKRYVAALYPAARTES